MISIRENVFETNSSSMHTLTVACPLKNKELYKKYVKEELSRWYDPATDSYNITIECHENAVDGDLRFDIRRYIPHFSINDKLLYALATIIQHHGANFVYPPYDASEYVTGWWENKYSKGVKEGRVPTKKEIREVIKKKNKKHKEYLKQYSKWLKANKTANEEAMKNFVKDIKKIQDSIESALNFALFDSYDPLKVHLTFKYDTSNGVVNYNSYKLDCFSTGCYGNEEFYHAVLSSWDVGEWVKNPYSGILAGSDEQSTLDYLLQEQKAKECLEEAYKNGYSQYDDEDIEYLEDEIDDKHFSKEEREANKKLFEKVKAGKIKKPNTGKLIFPLGG